MAPQFAEPSFAAPPPNYHSGGESSTRINGNTADNSRHAANRDDDDRRPPHTPDNRGRYALTLQRACDSALTIVRTNYVIANSNWAAPLAAAPRAVSTMAILFKAGGAKVAAALEVENLDVRDEQSNKVGVLPSKYFHTNLQHCSNIGRVAFREAQSGMTVISETARSMISGTGSIGYIVDLLEDPEDAKRNLKLEIEAMKSSAKKCLGAAQLITSKFEYWYLVISHLEESSSTLKSENIKEKKETNEQKQTAKNDALRQEETKRALQTKIDNININLHDARNNVERAQREYDSLLNRPLVVEPSRLEEERYAYDTVSRHMPGPKHKDRGIVVDTWESWWGKSKKHAAEDVAIEDAHSARMAKMKADMIEEAREQRKQQREQASKKLEDARNREERLMANLKAVYNELNESVYKLGEANADWEKARTEMKLLENKDIELDEIMDILRHSSRQLGQLKNQIEPIVDFFKTILTQIDSDVDQNVQAFLRGVEQNALAAGEAELVRVSQRSKERIMAIAFQMQGRFSAISDVAKAYVTISGDYIRPALARMEELSTTPDDQWNVKSQQFLEWCEEANSNINDFAVKATGEVEKQMGEHVNALARRAIEAAA